MRSIVFGVVSMAMGLCTTLLVAPAMAQTPSVPERSAGWNDATKITALSALGVQLLMPRVFYSDPEVTVGWKARWHVSVLAPSMTLATLALLNEQVLKDELAGHRPGCSEETQGGPGCESYGMLSTPTFTAFSALGQGLGIFLVDTSKWSDGRFNVGAFAGNVAVPAVLSVVTGIGRTAGDWEEPAQVWGTAGIGLALGMGIGALYASAQRPECGYTGGLICW
ncbi:MAG TPA: hypothetical protein VIM73_09040 [Polyangiaceae bacterium]